MLVLKFTLSNPTPYFTDKKDAAVASYILRFLAHYRYVLVLILGIVVSTDTSTAYFQILSLLWICWAISSIAGLFCS